MIMKKNKTKDIKKGEGEEETSTQQEKDELANLVQLQHNVKVQPDLYINETVKAVNIFKEEYQKVINNPAKKIEKFIQYSSFLAHVNDIFKKDLEFYQNSLIELLSTYAQILNPYVRFKSVQNLILICNKNLVPPIKALGLFFKLLNIKDKELRKLIINHIINDIKRRNAKHKNIAINKQLQNFVYDILKKNEDNLAKRALFIIIELYKKHIWNDDKTVNVIASGCFNKNPKVVKLACDFLMETTESNTLNEDSSDEEGPMHYIEKKGQSKKTKSKQARKEREIKKLRRRMIRKSKIQILNSFFPIDMIFNPQDFCDKLFNELRKKHFKFEVNLSMMAVLSRMIGRHKLLVLNFYSFLKDYLNPHQKELPRILGYFAESCHELIPPEDLQPILKHLIDNFVNERMHEEKITMGLNTIRAMSTKAPLVMDEDNLNYLAEFKNYKERNVSAAARALINLFRDINPDLLSKKHQGRFDLLDKKSERKVLKYGELQVFERLDGAELLPNKGEIPIEYDRILDDEDFKRIKALKKRKLESQVEKSEQRNMLDISKKDDNMEGVNIDDSEVNEEDEEDIDISDDVLDDDDEENGEDHEDGEDEEDDEQDEDEEVHEDDEDEEDDEEGEDEEIEDDEWEDEGDEVIEDEVAKHDKDKAIGVVKNKQDGNKSKQDVKDGSKVMPADKKTNKDDEDEMDLEDLSDVSSESEDANPHGFIDPSTIAKFKKTKRERKIEEQEKLHEKLKEKRYNGPKPKKGGTTNEEKRKHKPLLMLRPKKNKQKNQLTTIKQRIKSLKNKIGHVKSGKDFKKKASKRKK